MTGNSVRVNAKFCTWEVKDIQVGNWEQFLLKNSGEAVVQAVQGGRGVTISGGVR